MLTIEFVLSDPRASAYTCGIAAVLRASFPRIDDHPEGEWSVSALLAGSEKISQLHERFFGDPSDTDVMSFPSGDDLENNGGYLGDIAISLDVAAVQAERQRHSLSRELSYLALHGLLHLLGFRDDEAESRTDMLALQDGLFQTWDDEQVGVR